MADEAVNRATAQYPSAEITPAEFEQFVADTFAAGSPAVEGFAVTLHEAVTGVDGTYDFDATVRYELGGMAFLVLVEAKLHKNPIKRELVQVLHQKVQSVGGHKGVMVSTAPYQSGALEFAKTHGIALVTVTEGRFTYETKAATKHPALTREAARDLHELPTLVGHCYSAADEPGWTSITLVSSEYPEYCAELLLGVVSNQGHDTEL